MVEEVGLVEEEEERFAEEEGVGDDALEEEKSVSSLVLRERNRNGDRSEEQERIIERLILNSQRHDLPPRPRRSRPDSQQRESHRPRRNLRKTGSATETRGYHVNEIRTVKPFTT